MRAHGKEGGYTNRDSIRESERKERLKNSRKKKHNTTTKRESGRWEMGGGESREAEIQVIATESESERKEIIKKTDKKRKKIHKLINMTRATIKREQRASGRRTAQRHSITTRAAEQQQNLSVMYWFGANFCFVGIWYII